MSSFGADRSALRVSELAEEIGVHKSTASRILATLERRRFVRRDGELFVPGSEIVRIARLASAEELLAAAAGPALESLARDTGEAAIVGVRRGDEAYFIHQTPGDAILSVADWTGRSTPLHVSWFGKVFVAFGSPYTRAAHALHTAHDHGSSRVGARASPRPGTRLRGPPRRARGRAQRGRRSRVRRHGRLRRGDRRVGADVSLLRGAAGARSAL